MAEENGEKQVIDLGAIAKNIWSKKKIFLIVWVVTIALSALWIFPQPRYYKCEVSLAPEAGGEDVGGGLSSIASTFGLDLSGGSSDAIYPELYPELFESPEFIVGLFGIKVNNADKSIDCDYYTYLAKHQKQNWLTAPFTRTIRAIKFALSSKKPGKPGTAKAIDPFNMSEFDNMLVAGVIMKIQCSVDKKTNVITIKVKDQDPLICATLADSVREHLQNFIIKYRTSKATIDVQHYQQLADSANMEYHKSVQAYSNFCDAHHDVILQTMVSHRDELENDMQLKFNTYQAMQTQLQAMKAKLQERTPAFTTLRSATVPYKASEPKRMMFILGMLVLSTVVTSFWISRKLIFTKE